MKSPHVQVSVFLLMASLFASACVYAATPKAVTGVGHAVVLQHKGTAAGRLAPLSPGATITGLPTAPTNQGSVSLSIGGTDVATYKYRLDGGNWSSEHPVSDTLLIYGLADGEHAVTVAYANDAGQWQPLEITGTWTVQGATRIYPKVDFDSPALVSPGWPDPSMRITSTQGVVSKGLSDYWSYQFVEGDMGGPGECTWELWSVGYGSGWGEFEVVQAGSFYWAVTTPPRATVSGTPASPTNQTSATLTVGGANVTTYKWKLDDGTWSAALPVAQTVPLPAALSDGLHTVSVLGCGNGVCQEETSATTVSWTIDTVPPAEITFSGLPASQTTATGAVITVGGSGVAFYKWSLDGVHWSDPVATDNQIVLSTLADGPYTLSVLACDAAGNWLGTPATYSWTVDTTGPAAAVTTPPPSVTNSRDITLNVVAGDVVAYAVSVDGAAFGPETPVATPISLTGLSDGDHAVAIVGRDALGNWQSQENATTYAFAVDTVAPVAVISGAPANPTRTTSATLAVSGQGVTSYRYRLDNDDYQPAAAVSAAIALTGLADGSHTVSVLGIDAAGNVQSQATPTTATWVVDTAAPVAVITGAPASPTNLTTAILSVSGEGAAFYKFRRDNGAYSAQPIPCGTDISLAGLADGGHTVSVIGGDAAGNWQSQAAPTTVSWVVDTTAPIASLSGVPASPTNSRQAQITVGGDGVNLYQYKLGSGAYGPETVIATKISLSGLADGSQTITVKGCDLAGNWQQTPTTATWTIDTDAPVAVLSGAPSGSTNATAATIVVSGDGVAAYRASLDNAALGKATDPATPYVVGNLADGSHTVSVIARDAAGNWQATPTTATWTVDTTAPTPVLAGLPSGTVNLATATITVAEVAQYQYKIDENPWGPKTDAAVPIVLTGLGNGSHTLAVIGCDSLGNCQSQAAPVTATWIVDTQAPDMPTIPVASNPSRQTTSTPTFVWTSVADAADYLVEVADNAGFDLPRVRRTVSGRTHYRLQGPEALDKKGMWYWRVRTRDAVGNVSDWASASFQYQAGGLVPLLLLKE